MKIESQTESRTCVQCQKQYEHERIMLNDRDLSANVMTCDSCSDAAEQAQEIFKRETRAKAQWERVVPAEYRKTDVEYPDYPKPIHAACLAWIKGDGLLDQEHLLFLGLLGESGICKTRIASQMVKRYIWNGEQVLWVNSSQFQWACQNQFNDHEKVEATKWLKQCRYASVLVLDDIGSLKSTEIVSDNLYNLLEYRTTHGLPMIWTSNESLDEMLPKLGEKPRKRSISRLAGFSNMINL